METTRPPPSFPGWRPFNEATTSRPWRRGLRQSRPHSDVRLQRSHDLSAVETSPSGKRWSAQGNLQRSHDLSAVETILRVINLMIGKDLQRSHDLSAVETRSFQCTLSKPRRTFNEATTSRPWRLLCFICNRFRVANLQRSHDLSAVETLLHYHTEHHLGATSTKPRPLGRGDLRLIPPPPHVQRTSTKPRPLGRGDRRARRPRGRKGGFRTPPWSRPRRPRAAIAHATLAGTFSNGKPGFPVACERLRERVSPPHLSQGLPT